VYIVNFLQTCHLRGGVLMMSTVLRYEYRCAKHVTCGGVRKGMLEVVVPLGRW